jgi:hypothetical protein
VQVVRPRAVLILGRRLLLFQSELSSVYSDEVNAEKFGFKMEGNLPSMAIKPLRQVCIFLTGSCVNRLGGLCAASNYSSEKL